MKGMGKCLVPPPHGTQDNAEEWFMSRPKTGFTLIELLIVVAIIGILAAIAVPNFMNAKIKAELARLQAHVKATADALELYRLDNQYYIPTQPGAHDLHRLTTPVAYLSTLPEDIFMINKVKNNKVVAPSGLNWDYTGSDLGWGWRRAPIAYIFGSVYELFGDGYCISQMTWVDEGPRRWKAQKYREDLYDSSNGLQSGGCVTKYGGDDTPLRH